MITATVMIVKRFLFQNVNIKDPIFNLTTKIVTSRAQVQTKISIPFLIYDVFSNLNI